MMTVTDLGVSGQGKFKEPLTPTMSHRGHRFPCQGRVISSRESPGARASGRPAGRQAGPLIMARVASA